MFWYMCTQKFFLSTEGSIRYLHAKTQDKRGTNMVRGRDYTANSNSHTKGGGLRLLIAILAAMAFAGAIWVGLSDARCASLRRSLDACETETVRVIAGDTLWEIAASHGAQGTSTYDVVEWIKRRNGLATSELKPGERILVPLVAAS